MLAILLTVSTTAPTTNPPESIAAPIATLIAAVIAAIVGLITCILTYRHNRSVLTATIKHNEQTIRTALETNDRTVRALQASDRRKKVQSALEELLIPLQSQLGQMKSLFNIVKVGKPPEFRTLLYLLDPHGYEIDGKKAEIFLSDSDKKILEEILAIEAQVENLLITKGGLVDDPVLHKAYVPNPAVTDVDAEKLKELGLFAIAIAHFRIIRLAYNGAIKGNAPNYAHLVYPRELNSKVDEAITRLRAELATL